MAPSNVLRSSAACAEVREVLGDKLPKKPVPTSPFSPARRVTPRRAGVLPEGVQTRTLWGELALQLGGVDLYKLIEANDQSRSRATGDCSQEILRKTAPCLILLDELADYCVGGMAVSVGQGTLADQTVSFVQQLTEAASQVPGAVIVATLPASHLEVASNDKGQEILSRSWRSRFRANVCGSEACRRRGDQCEVVDGGCSRSSAMPPSTPRSPTAS